MNNKAVVVLYGHLEAYPPTLNALAELSTMFDQVVTLSRPMPGTKVEYGENIQLRSSGAAMTSRQQEALPLPKRLGLFYNFVKDLRQLVQTERPSLVLLYDPLALLAYSWAQRGSWPKHKVWYHNHDVLEPVQKQFSLGWWARRAEQKIFPQLDIFSLPSQERKAYFPMDLFKGDYFFLPNQPAVSFYRQFFDIKKSDSTWRVIFQGSIGEGHGIEELLELMPAKIKGRPLHLVLKGWIREGYKAKLMAIIQQKGLEHNVSFVGFTPYIELPKLTASCHIGIAIFTKSDIMNKTLGTASNKIYEYAAVGLPILYFDNHHFKSYLGQYDWAVPTDLSKPSLLSALERIAENFDELSASAQNAFLKKLNFEEHFKQVRKYFGKNVNKPVSAA